MKQLLQFLLLLTTASAIAQPADTLIYERFETGGFSFDLNTADLNGVSAAVGYNQWILNNVYLGGNGSINCGGFPTTFTIPNTPPQPALITGGPATNYLHISSDAGQLSGIYNCSFLAANGLCGNNEYNFAAMNTDVSTIGYDSVTVSFLWLCDGGNNVYGEVYYSIDSGISWTLFTTPINKYRNQNTWASQSISIPVLANQSTLRLGFRFVNEVALNASDPGFGIDEIVISARNAAAAPIASFAVSDSVLCEGDCVNFSDLSSGNPTSWFWIFQGSVTSFSNQQNPALVCYPTAGTYPVTLIVQSPSGTDTLTTNAIVVNAPLQPVITVSGDTLIAPSGFLSYQWHNNGTLIPGATNDTLIVVAGGGYSVSVTDGNNCTGNSPVVNLSTGLYAIESNEVLFFPNPVMDIITFNAPENFKNYLVYDNTGKIIMTDIIEKSAASIIMNKLESGIYLMRINLKDGKYIMKRFVKL